MPVIRAVRGSSDRIKRRSGIGLQVSSITMTVFYIILLYVWKATFPQLQAPVAVEVLIWLSAILRILICLLPQNNWCTDEGNSTLSVLRNAVFAFTGLGVIILYAISGNTYDYHMTRMVAAILISFGCYLPVTLFSKTKPKVGLLMIPKTCSYMWIIAMGLQLPVTVLQMWLQAPVNRQNEENGILKVLYFRQRSFRVWIVDYPIILS